MLYLQTEAIIEMFKSRNFLPLIWSPWDDYLWIRGIDIDRDNKLPITAE